MTRRMCWHCTTLFFFCDIYDVIFSARSWHNVTLLILFGSQSLTRTVTDVASVDDTEVSVFLAVRRLPFHSLAHKLIFALYGFLFQYGYSGRERPLPLELSLQERLMKNVLVQRLSLEHGDQPCVPNRRENGSCWSWNVCKFVL
jgi:hypothetical protein